MNKKTIVIIGGTLLISCLFTNAMAKLQGEGKIINKQVASYSYKDNYFIIPDSSIRYLSEDDLIGLSKDQLEIARNEIYARHGYIFVSNEWKDFFVNEPWYTPISTSVTLNSTEEYNVARILEEEARR